MYQSSRESRAQIPGAVATGWVRSRATGSLRLACRPGSTSFHSADLGIALQALMQQGICCSDPAAENFNVRFTGTYRRS